MRAATAGDDAVGDMIPSSHRRNTDPDGHNGGVTRTPAELIIDGEGRVSIPLGLLAEAGLDPGSGIVAFSDGDGRLVLRRHSDAMRELIERGTL